MPDGAVYVGRPSRWGNPFPVPEYCSRTEEFFRQDAVEKFRAWLAGQDELQAAIREQLAGRDLACWCRLDMPCHADVLLEVAND